MDKFKVVDSILPISPGFEIGKIYVGHPKELGYEVPDIGFIPSYCVVVLESNVSDIGIEEGKRINVENNIGKGTIVTETIITEKNPKEKIIERCQNFQIKYRDKIEDKNIYRELFRNELDHAIDKHLQ